MRPKKQLSMSCMLCEVPAEAKPDGTIPMVKIKVGFAYGNIYLASKNIELTGPCPNKK
jgi:hypothetical protein